MLIYLALPCKSSHHSNNCWNQHCCVPKLIFELFLNSIYNSLVFSAEIESGNSTVYFQIFTKNMTSAL